jgi:tRNA U34 5-carboxymethylaminomethyl modifying enzyme MnmG/GidA
VDDARWDAYARKRDAVSRETERLKSTWVHPGIFPAEAAERLLGKAIEREYNLATCCAARAWASTPWPRSLHWPGRRPVFHVKH